MNFRSNSATSKMATHVIKKHLHITTIGKIWRSHKWLLNLFHRWTLHLILFTANHFIKNYAIIWHRCISRFSPSTFLFFMKCFKDVEFDAVTTSLKDLKLNNLSYLPYDHFNDSFNSKTVRFSSIQMWEAQIVTTNSSKDSKEKKMRKFNNCWWLVDKHFWSFDSKVLQNNSNVDYVTCIF